MYLLYIITVLGCKDVSYQGKHASITAKVEHGKSVMVYKHVECIKLLLVPRNPKYCLLDVQLHGKQDDYTTMLRDLFLPARTFYFAFFLLPISSMEKKRSRRFKNPVSKACYCFCMIVDLSIV